ncbi:sunset domain-containing protein [Amycolatopsis pigmentata]|uniref:Uncharacterized protein n=1 Tax=Amycolatopsis pigmentata TaxID=450801 RepID=A0ABW5FV08_9PSEU
MSIFGQVWLWSIAAFLIGVLLTWMMLVRPVQARNRKLERRLREARTAVSAPPRRPVRPAAPVEDKRQPADRYPPGPGFPDRYQPDPVLADVYQPDPGLTDRFEPEPRPTAQFDRHQAEPQPVDGYLAEPGMPPGYRPEPQPADVYPAEPGMPPGYQPEPQTTDRNQPESEPFWATFDPEPEPEPEPEAGEQSRELAWFEQERAAKPGADKSGADKEDAQPLPSPATEFVGLNSVLEPDNPADAGVTSVFKKIDDAPGEERGSERGSLFPTDTPAPEQASPTYAFGGDQKSAGNEEATEVTQVLPRRKPQKTPRSAFEPPRKRAEPSMRPIERREPVLLDEGGQSGSLFEPVTPANSAQASGDKASAEGSAREASVPSGPFGPGSAMPRPGGGRPADDFAVKASVTALRYCTEDSPQYPRMVAEVWFRTTADAERVGFRPVT